MTGCIGSKAGVPRSLTPNNLLSDKYVAISNIAGYYANMRVRNFPYPLVPLPPKTHGSVSGSVTKTVTLQRGADHSIVCTAPRLSA
jgi:hypothetical protein